MRRISARFVAMLVFSLGLTLTTSVYADVVSQQSARWRTFDVELDLTNYQNAAAKFNFRSLLRSDAGGFSAVSAPDAPFQGPLYAPRAGVDDPNESRGSALFNLSAYDGQTVLLTVNFDRRSSTLRRGYINVDNLRIDVASAQTAAATIPEPSTMFLMGAALLASLGVAKTRRQLQAA